MKKIYFTIWTLGLLFSPVLLAQSEICTITEERDLLGSGTTTLRGAIDRANDGNPDRRRCEGGILLDFDTMDMIDPNLVLQFRTAGAGNEYVFGGVDAAHTVTLDFQNIPSSSNASGYCNVIVKRVTHLKIQNLRIKNAPYSGICLGGLNDDFQVTNVTLDNVHVERAGGHGILLRENSQNNLIKANSSISNVSGDAIHIEGTRTVQLNRLEATSRSTEGISITPGGLADFGEKTGEDFDFSNLGGIPISMENETRIQISEMFPTDDTRRVFRISGDVVRGDTRVTGVQRIQIYALDPNRGNEGRFYSYVLNANEFGGDLGVRPEQTAIYTFQFEIDTGSSGVNSQFIALVPELSNGQIAGSSEIIEVVEGGGTGGLIGPDRTRGAAKLTSVTACLGARSNRRGGPIATRTFDSDMDGLYDEEEDLDGSCECEPDQDFSCWMQPDTDGDGILDSIEARGRQILNREAIARVTDSDEQSRLQEGRDGGFYCAPETVTVNGLVVEVDPCNADREDEDEEIAGGVRHFFISNAYDNDSDEDGIPDAREDRRRTFNVWKGTVATVDDVRYTCSLDTGVLLEVKNGEATPTRIPLIGDAAAKWMVYDKRPVADGGKPVVYTGWRGDNAAASVDLEMAACFYRGLGEDPAAVYNGAPTHPQETEVYAKDADREIPCLEDDPVFLVLDKNFLTFAPDNEITGFNWGNFNTMVPSEISNRNQAEELRDEMRQICLDTDDDGIPDCLEWQGRAGNQSCDLILGSARERSGFISPYRADTDGDEIIDGFDTNPLVSNALQNGADRLNESERNALRGIFRGVQNPLVRVLQCFLDRDGDGLYDCEEDMNFNGGYDARNMDLTAFLAEMVRIGMAESDPLNADSDEDGLDDKTERYNTGTNPQTPDTDGDTLSDRLEVLGNALDNYADQGPGACSTLRFIPALPGQLDARNAAAVEDGSIRLGTNPLSQDTDGDGILDQVEITCEFPSVFDGGGSLIFDVDDFSPLKLCSNPLSADSDGDGRNDIEEIGSDGLMQRGETAPCDADNDSDADGLTDVIEEFLRTDPNDPDHDRDGLKDGEEDLNHDGIIQTEQGETQPLVADTDGDGLDDGVERLYATDPNRIDSDDDGISDGVEVNFSENSSFTGRDTDPTNPDTDGDGLCDGNTTVTNGGLTDDVSCIRGEDLNTNGVVDHDPADESILLETDPRLADTDQDGIPDKTEICSGGVCNFSVNIAGATRGAPGGCFSLAPVAPLAPSSMLYVYGLILMLNRVYKRKFQKKQ